MLTNCFLDRYGLVLGQSADVVLFSARPHDELKTAQELDVLSERFIGLRQHAQLAGRNVRDQPLHASMTPMAIMHSIVTAKLVNALI
jgi:hypothetical protein